MFLFSIMAKPVRAWTPYASVPMAEDLSVSDAAGAVVTGWRVVDHVQLLLAIRGRPGEARLICLCGRCHWIVREHRGDDGAVLLATCHSCGTRLGLALEAQPLPNP
jgi:hypothetical protein